MGLATLAAQEHGRRVPVPVRPDPAPVFDRIARGVSSGNADTFADLFGATVVLRIGAQEHGTISGNQARTILGTFILNHRPSAFSFSRVSLHGSIPFAIGPYTHVVKGVRSTSQVYVAIQFLGGRWVISQFNLY
jgi:hypothetical protein